MCPAAPADSIKDKATLGRVRVRKKQPYTLTQSKARIHRTWRDARTVATAKRLHRDCCIRRRRPPRFRSVKTSDTALVRERACATGPPPVSRQNFESPSPARLQQTPASSPTHQPSKVQVSPHRKRAAPNASRRSLRGNESRPPIKQPARCQVMSQTK